MSMFVWEDGTVTGSVDVVELEAIQNALKPLGKRKLAGLSWPIETAAQVQAELDGTSDDDDEPAKTVKASESKPAKADPTADAEAQAISEVDLPAILDKATGKKKEA